MMKTTNKIERSYNGLSRLPSFRERFEYLRLNGSVGIDTFGYDRYLNQAFYSSREWKRFRREILMRDDGCDLGLEGYGICGIIIVHHINPISIEDIEKGSSNLLDPDNVICVSDRTHRAIHYGDWNLIPKGLIERKPNDMCPWKTGG